MTISESLRRAVRQRAQYRCEYCNVSEVQCGGELTIDHFQPPRRGGSYDDPENLLSCCPRCNQYKSDYWPTTPTDVPLWNPRTMQRDQHMIELANGTLYPVTAIGDYTIRRLRLNRAPLIANRLQRHRDEAQARLLSELRQLITLQEQLQQQHAQLIQEQRQLLEQQRALLALLLNSIR